MKLKFIRPVIVFCLTITLAFNSVSLAFAAPEDSYDLPLEIQQQQQERLLKLLPGFYEKLANTYDTELTRELNHSNLTNEISELKEIQEKQKDLLAEVQNSQQIINDSLQQLEEKLKEQQGEQLQELQKEQKEKQEKLQKLQEEAENRQIFLETSQKLQKTLEKTLYSQVMPELPKLVKIFYEINNSNDSIGVTDRYGRVNYYISTTYAQNKTELLKSLQDIIQELQRQEVEQLQYQCNKQKEEINNYKQLLSKQEVVLSTELTTQTLQ